MITPVATLVEHHPLLAGLPGDVVERVAGCSRNVAVRRGRLLFAEDAPADTLYLVRRGVVAVEVHQPGRGPATIDVLGPGRAVGWSWLFPPYRWSFDARAVDDVGAVAVDAGCLRDKAETDPVFGYEIMKRITSVILDHLQATRLRLLDMYAS